MAFRSLSAITALTWLVMRSRDQRRWRSWRSSFVEWGIGGREATGERGGTVEVRWGTDGSFDMERAIGVRWSVEWGFGGESPESWGPGVRPPVGVRGRAPEI